MGIRSGFALVSASLLLAQVGCSVNVGPGLGEFNQFCSKEKGGQADAHALTSISEPYGLLEIARYQLNNGAGGDSAVGVMGARDAWQEAYQSWGPGGAALATFSPLTVSEAQPLFPAFVLDDPVLRKFVNGVHQSAVEGTEKPSVDLTRSELKHSVMALTAGLGLASDSRVDVTDTDKKTPFFRLAKFYLQSYFVGENGYVNREGTVLKRTEVKDGAITNDHITPIVEILAEAAWDTMLPTPVWVKPKSGGKTPYHNASGKRPTVSVYAEGVGIEIDLEVKADGTKDAITETELKAIRYLSGLAGDQSQIISGMLFRLLGDLELSFVVGGHFSFGDNETFSEMVDTLSEVALRRTAEMGAACLFLRIDTPDVTSLTAAQAAGVEGAAVELLNELQNIQ